MIRKCGAFLLSVGLAISSSLAANIYTNGGFEDGVTGWNLWVKENSGAAATVSIDSAAYEGKNCLAVTVTAINPDTNWVIQLQDPIWESKKYVEYRLTGYIKADTNRTIHLAIQGDSSSRYTYRKGSDISATTNWTFFETQPFICDWGGPDSMNYFFYCGGSTGTYYFDSLSLDSTGYYPPEDAVRHFSVSTKTHQAGFIVKQMSDCLLLNLTNPSTVSKRVSILNLDGRIFSSMNIPGRSESLQLPKPPSGTWIVKVNDKKSMIQIP